MLDSVTYQKICSVEVEHLQLLKYFNCINNQNACKHFIVMDQYRLEKALSFTPVAEVASL